MSYDAAKKEFGKEPVQIVELDLDLCENTYGVAPCTASGPGPLKCYNTFSTCQDEGNYNKGSKTYRFSSIRIDDIESVVLPTLIGVQTAPSRVTPGKGLGIRSSVRATIQDMPWNDVGMDPYLSDRDFNPDDRGSFWARFLKRNQFWQNRIMRVRQGYLDTDGIYRENRTLTRTYIINKISGPDTSGKISIEGKDILRFADKSRAQIPAANEAQLTEDISSSQTSFAFTDPTGAIASAFASGQQYIIIDDEIMLLSSVTGSVPNYTANVTRGTMPTFYTGTMTAEDHNDSASIQDCYLYENERIDDILFDLLNRVAGIDAQYLDTVQWAAKIDEGLSGYLFSRLLIEPAGVKDLVDEITEHTISIWWDERTPAVLMDTLFSREPNGSQYNDQDNLIEDKTATTVDIEGRVSQAWVYIGIRSPLLTDGDAQDYRRVVIRADLGLEGANGYDSAKIKTIKSNWLPGGSGSIAAEIASRLVRNYREAKTVLSITMDPKDDENWNSDIIEVKTRYVRDEFGAANYVPYRVMEVNEKITGNGVLYQYLLQQEILVDVSRYGLITPDDMEDYRDALESDREKYFFICADGADTFPDGRPVNVIQ